MKDTGTDAVLATLAIVAGVLLGLVVTPLAVIALGSTLLGDLPGFNVKSGLLLYGPLAGIPGAIIGGVTAGILAVDPFKSRSRVRTLIVGLAVHAAFILLVILITWLSTLGAVG